MSEIAQLKTAADRFTTEVDNDIDYSAHGGVRWWKNSLGKDNAGLLTSYLDALVKGVTQSIDDAIFSIDEFAESQKRWNYTASQLMTAGQKWNLDFLRSTYGNPKLERRTRLMTMHSEQCLSNLVTAQDRIGALALIVAGWDFKRDTVLKAAWNQFAGAAKKLNPAELSAGSTPKAITKDPDVSAALLKLAYIPEHSDDYGPCEWLKWLRETRNSQIHRARSLRPVLHEENRDGSYFYHNVFWKDPSRFFIQSLASRDQPYRKKERGLYSLLLVRDPVEVMQGLYESTCAMLSDLFIHLTGLWVARRKAPGAVPQPLSQWPDLGSKVSWCFDGYGRELKVRPGTVVLNPSDSRLLRVAGVFDDQ